MAKNNKGCLGITYKGRKCSRKVDIKIKYCWQHNKETQNLCILVPQVVPQVREELTLNDRIKFVKNRTAKANEKPVLSENSRRAFHFFSPRSAEFFSRIFDKTVFFRFYRSIFYRRAVPIFFDNFRTKKKGFSSALIIPVFLAAPNFFREFSQKQLNTVNKTEIVRKKAGEICRF